MSDLREQVARRLAKMAESLPYLDDFELHDFKGEEHGGWFGLADEVVRLMEWARREMKAESQRLIQGRQDGRNEFVSISDVLHVHDVCHDCPLTLPPEDWQP